MITILAIYRFQTSVEGSTPDIFTIRNLPLSAGRVFNSMEEQNAAQVAVIGQTVAENIFGEGVSPIGKKIQIGSVYFQVIGQLTSQGSTGATNNDDKIIIPYQTMQKKLAGDSGTMIIYASVKDANQMDQAERQVEMTLRTSHQLSFQDTADFTVTNQATLLGTLDSVNDTLQMFLGGIASISLLVGGIGIMNIMLVSVTERTKEIGLRKALGATKNVILRQFIWESGIVGVAGGILGIVIGVIGSWIAGVFMQSSVPINGTAVWLSFIVSLVIGIGFGLYPAYRAAKLSPILALRYE